LGKLIANVDPCLSDFPRESRCYFTFAPLSQTVLGFATFLRHQALSGTEAVMKTAQMCKEIFEELGDRTGSLTAGPQRSKEFYETLKTCPIMSMFTM
jgi:hypothetical protein